MPSFMCNKIASISLFCLFTSFNFWFISTFITLIIFIIESNSVFFFLFFLGFNSISSTLSPFASFWAFIIILFSGFTIASEINIPTTITMQENTNIVPNISIFAWFIWVSVIFIKSWEVTYSEVPIKSWVSPTIPAKKAPIPIIIIVPIIKNINNILFCNFFIINSFYLEAR